MGRRRTKKEHQNTYNYLEVYGWHERHLSAFNVSQLQINFEAHRSHIRPFGGGCQQPAIGR
eukprot:6410077-Pyramimonas_sp.AAC.1